MTEKPISLEEFICATGRSWVDCLTHEVLIDLVGRLRLSDELIESCTGFAEDHYARNLVCRTPYFELLVLCWRPGHESTIHDHAGSLNAIRVHHGVLTSRLFRPTGGSAPRAAGPVRPTGREEVSAGRLIGVDRDGIHQLANTSGADLVTVHVYAPPLMELTVYSTETRLTERRALRYTVAEDLA